MEGLAAVGAACSSGVQQCIRLLCTYLTVLFALCLNNHAVANDLGFSAVCGHSFSGWRTNYVMLLPMVYVNQCKKLFLPFCDGGRYDPVSFKAAERVKLVEPAVYGHAKSLHGGMRGILIC
jgi:hypothetical protein